MIEEITGSMLRIGDSIRTTRGWTSSVLLLLVGFTVCLVASVSRSSIEEEEVVGFVGHGYAVSLRVVIPFRSSFGLVEESGVDELELGKPELDKLVLDKLEVGFDLDDQTKRWHDVSRNEERDINEGRHRPKFVAWIAIGAIGPPQPFKDGWHNSSIVRRSGTSRSPFPSTAISELFKRVGSERDLLRIVSSGLSREMMNKNFLEMMRQIQTVKIIDMKCETYGGPHSFTECPAIGGYTPETAYDTTGDDANRHIDKFLEITQHMKQNEVSDDALCLSPFPYSLTHHAISWNLGEPSSLFDIKEVMNNNQEPPPQNNNGPPPMVRPNGQAPRTMEELCQPSINGRGGPIASILIQAIDSGLRHHMIQQVQNIRIETYLATDSVPSRIDDAEFDPEGDIRLIEEILNNDPYSPLPLKNLKCEELKSVKSLVDEPLELELKDLPSHLEYAFLEGTNKLPVIISKNLKDKEKEGLIKVLKSHKQAITWKLSDIKGIDP
nr:reverse transcriptase domain-containing protein [Tanacetum cinerariifolium]